jgi:MFS family permease
MTSEPEPSPDACPLSERAQTRNVLLIGAITGINYLAAPTTYLWIHAPLCKRLGADATVANLPSTAYYAFAVAPLLVSWAFPSPALFKRIMVLSNALFAAMCAVVVAALSLPLPASVKIGLLILHGAVTGATLTTSVAILFEVMGRGVSVARRGQALGLAYGVGPMLAALASVGLQLVLPEKWTDSDGWLEFPWNYATEFAVAVPIMSLVAYLCSLCVIPPAESIVEREDFGPWLSGGVRGFLGNRVIRWTTILAVLMFCGYHIGDNMALYTRYSMDSMPERFLGFQQGFRYGFKILSGFLLGWLLTTTNPKVVLLVSASFGLTGILWALGSSGYWYLVSFGFVGAGELFGPYVTNYILACSPASQMRRNMAFTVLLMVPAAAAGPLYGGIADIWGAYGYRAVGYQLSFATSAAFISVALVMMLSLPARPRPEETEITKSLAMPEEVVS